jgi:glycosyltransferase involved in cell wall biosynthesis
MNDISQSSSPIVSVVIPVRNCRDYIDESVASVLSQSYGNLELIVIDDGSDDDDYTRLLDLDPRVRVARLAGSGVSKARNVGMTMARGQYIAFLDADDVWFPGKLEAQVCYFENNPEVGVVFGGFIRWLPDRQGVFRPSDELASTVCSDARCDPARSGWLYLRLLNGLLVGMNTAVIRRSIYESVGGFNESMRQAEDYDFWLKASRLMEMHSLVGPVALYRIHSASAMHRLASESGLASLLRSARLRWGLAQNDGQAMSAHQFSQRLGSVYFDHGYSHYWQGSLAVARKAFVHSIGHRYRVVKSLAYLMMIYAVGLKQKIF